MKITPPTPDDQVVFDLFLAHGSADKPLVRELYEELTREGYHVFLDSEELTPGEGWRRALESCLSASRCVAVCVGSAGPGPWTELEIDFALRRNRSDASFLVIPILLPGARFAQLREISPFLEGFQGVNLTAGIRGSVEFRKLKALIEQVIAGTVTDRRAATQLPAGDVQRGVARQTERFVASLRPFLAGGRQIPRTETQEILKHLDDGDARLVVVHGAAGCGKSGILLEVVDDLATKGTPFLPLRLDRHELRGTVHRFAANELLLPGSPGECLAKLGTDEHGAVLLLDQLDALRWTGAHSGEAWEVCREMILDTLSASHTTKVVVCCRTFDLEHDPQLKSWKEQSKDLREVKIGDLSEEMVRIAIDRAASVKGEARPIEDRELDLLKHVHHLQMWLTLYPRLGSRGSLNSRRALMESFWQDRRTRLAEAGLSADRIETIEARLIDEMEGGAKLATSVGTLRLSSRELEAYQSLLILQMDPETHLVTFCHQSYLDYLVALRIVSELEIGERSVIQWLGAREDQSLFRREQLRLILDELKDRDAAAYVRELRSLLHAKAEVRFHLRLLSLQFLAQITEPSPAEREIVLDLIDEAFWRPHVLAEIVRGKPAWFEVVDDAGVFERWLTGDDAKLRDEALEMVSYVVEHCGDRVERLLRPHLNESPDWNRRIVWTLRFDPSKDSESLFQLRLDLTKCGDYKGDHIDWGELAKRQPDRLVVLTPHLMLALANDHIEGRERRRPGRRSQLDLENLKGVAASALPPALRSIAWESIAKAVSLLARAGRYESESPGQLETLAVDFETLEPVLNFLRDLGTTLLNESWAEFVSLGTSVTDQFPLAEIVFLDNLKEGPQDTDLADWALEWLMEDPWRARLRIKRDGSAHSLCGALIERFACGCSDEVYQRVESWILDYREPDLLIRYRWRHERFKPRNDEIGRPSPFGQTAHALLPMLPPDRTSERVHRRIAELERKFGRRAAIDLEDGLGSPGFVASPVGSEILMRLGDSSVLRLVSSKKLRDRGTRFRWKGGRYEESSVETIASDFRRAAQEKPDRFGRLLLPWPSEGHPEIFEAILSGLSFPPDQQRREGSEDWKPPSHDLLEEILALPMVNSLARRPRDTRIAESLCSIMSRYAEYPWTTNVLNLLVWIAQHHPHPEPGNYPIGAGDETIKNVRILETNALNVTRGRAGFTIRDLLFQHPDSFSTLRPALERLVRDPHPAVRVAAIGACLPVINVDKDLAVAWFSTAGDGPDPLLATRETHEFLRYSYQTHLTALLPVLDRMITSEFPQTVREGAYWVAAAFLVTGRIGERFEACISGTADQRHGIAKVAAHLLGNSEFAEAAKQTLLRLADDPDENVAQAVAQGFGHLDLGSIEADRGSWTRFARSRAFQTDPTPLLRALGEHSGHLLPFADCVLAAGTTFAEELADQARNFSHSHAGDAHLYLLPILLRLYEQAKDHDADVYRRCLDLWDRLLEQRVGSVMGLTQKLDSM